MSETQPLSDAPTISTSQEYQGSLNSQPEVYETPDIPTSSFEDVVPSSLVEEPQEDIDLSGIQAKSAFSNFAKASQNYNPPNFSDSLKSRKKRGYHISNFSELELVATPSKLETPLQKFLRLQSEIKELTIELENSSEKPQTSEPIPNFLPNNGEISLQDLEELKLQVSLLDSSLPSNHFWILIIKISSYSKQKIMDSKNCMTLWRL
eukprot:TRINITY_DN11608_c0_g1_i1.p1 TRINITY_DN11608_c0_g1~~TRINITY_DN11608_c0_g1_i1.p1  ORF type:complete len:216 (-),score=37.14 TRINITY_DN11608_c0_g1_i1:77-697(-)